MTAPKLSEAQREFRAHWTEFCDADYFDGIDTFPDRMCEAGLIRLRPVKKSDIEDDPFAAERGIERGGMLWEPTPAGRQALKETRR